MKNVNDCILIKRPCCILNLQESGIHNPSSVFFTPDGKFLAVCNRLGGEGLTFYQQDQKSKGVFGAIPSFKLTEEEFFEHGLSTPHGIAISRDGKLIAMVHKKYFKTEFPKGESGFSILEKVEDPQSAKKYNVSYVELCGSQPMHAIDIHPSNQHVLITEEQGAASIYSKDPDSQKFVKTFKIPNTILSVGKGFKGAAFSHDGKRFAVTSLDPFRSDF